MVVCNVAGLFSVLRFKGMSHEAHFSAEQPCPRTPSRLSPSDVDGWRSRSDPGTSGTRSSQAVSLITLTKRADFLAANTGKRAPMPGFVLLVRPRNDGDTKMRVGYTVTKKIGGSVIRNRMKRRFRALARDLLPANGATGADHVIIGRAGGVERDYAALRSELLKALARLTR